MSKATIKGDIKTLYAYYRLSDFEMTNISLVDKTLSETVAFEGHMNWSFNRCIFNAPFSFGVIGDRLEGDLRGSPDEEPFPPYGSNGVVFDGCVFNTNFNIEDNCVVLLKDCKFNNSDPVIFKKNTRVEFINCEFFGPVEFDYFCEVKFRGCSFDGLEYAIDAKNHCKLFLDETTSTGISTYFISLKNDCHVDVSSQEKTSYETNGDAVFKGEDHCTIRLYGLGTVKSTTGPALSVAEDSKLEARDVDLIQSPNGYAVSITDNSEGYFKEIPQIESTQASAFYIDHSVLRFRNVENILSTQGHGIEARDSTVYGLETQKVNSVQNSAVYGLFTNFDLAQGQEITSDTAEAISVNGESNSVVRDFVKIEGNTTGVVVNDDARLLIQRVSETIMGVGDYGCNVTNGILRIASCPRVEGAKTAIKSSSGARIQTRDVSNISGTSEAGLYFEDTTYDINTTVEGIFGVEVGCYFENSRGVLSDVELIVGSDIRGFVLNGVSGPTEISRVRKIEAEAQAAAIFTSDNAQVQVNEIGEISSNSGNAIEFSVGENSSLDFYDVEKITSVDQIAILGSTTGRFTLTKAEHISSQNNQIVVITGDGINSFVRFSDIALCSAVASEESPFFVSTVNTIELERIVEITVEETKASVVELQGRGVDYGSIKLLNCAKVYGAECSNVVFTHNALLTDIVGTDEECEISGTTVKFAALSVKDTNLYVSNYTKIEAEEEGHAIDLEVLNARGVEMRLYAIREITGANDGIHYEGSGTLKLSALPQVSGKSDEENALYFLGNPFSKIEMHNVATVPGKGKVTATNILGQIHRCYLGASISQIASRLEFYNSTVVLTADRILDSDASSSLYFFNTAVSGGQIVAGGAVLADVSSLPQGDVAGGGIFNKCALTDYWKVSGALIGNNLETSNILDISGGIGTAALLNGYKATGAEGIEIGDDCGLILNSAEFAGGSIAVNTQAALVANSLNGSGIRINGLTGSGMILNRFELDDYELDSNAGVILNSGSITQPISFSGGNAVLFNKLTCGGTITCGGDNALLFNNLTCGNITCDSSALLFNAVSAGTTQIGSSALIGCGVGATLRLGTGGDAVTSGGALSNLLVPSTANFIAAGGVSGTPLGAGNAVVVTASGGVEPTSTGTGISVRGTGAAAQIFLKTQKTKQILGDASTDILIQALEGKYTLEAEDISVSSTTDIFHEADGDIIRNATGDIVDIATNLDRQGSGTITDTATAIVHDPPV